jgi:hypothetical protein
MPSTLILYLWAMWAMLVGVVEPALFVWDVFEMAVPIQSTAKCEARSFIRFLNAKRERPAEIHKQIFAVYGNLMNRPNATKWCREFSEGRSDVHDEQRMCMKMSWRGSKGRRRTSMTRGYRSWFQDLIHVWTMPATMFKNQVMYRQFIQSVAFVN